MLNDISPVRGSRRSNSGISLNLMLIQSKVQDGALFLYDQNKQEQDIFKPILNQYFLYRQTMLLYFTGKKLDQHPWRCLIFSKVTDQ